MKLILVRHGETKGQSSIRFYGKTDVPLSKEGIMQMEAVRNELKDEIFHSVYSSPLSRSYEGARIVIGNRDIKIDKIEEFTEINFGLWEGLTLEEIRERDPDLFSLWRKAVWNFNYPEGDNREEFVQKVRRGVDKVLSKADKGCHLLVLHKGILRVIMEYLLDIREEEHFAFEADLGSIHNLERLNGKWRLKTLNYTAHLESL